MLYFTAVAILVMTESLPSEALTNGHSLEKKNEKRKRENGKHESSSKNEDVASKPSKEERREAKRLKKLEKEK